MPHSILFRHVHDDHSPVVCLCVQAMEKTARGYHEGGDADWEEKKLKNYAHSEVRLAEIQSMLCTDIVVGKSQVSLFYILLQFYSHCFLLCWTGHLFLL